MSRVSSVKMGKIPPASCEKVGSWRAEHACGCGNTVYAGCLLNKVVVSSTKKRDRAILPDETEAGN